MDILVVEQPAKVEHGLRTRATLFLNIPDSAREQALVDVAERGDADILHASVGLVVSSPSVVESDHRDVHSIVRAARCKPAAESRCGANRSRGQRGLLQELSTARG